MGLRTKPLADDRDEHAMGEEQVTLFAPEFNRSVRVEARAERLTSDAGAVVLRALLDRLSFAALVGRHLTDPRAAARVRHPFLELVRTYLLLWAQGWTEQRDADLLRQDPALRLAVSCRRGTAPVIGGEGAAAGLASQPTLSRLLGALSSVENRAGLSALLLALAERRRRGRSGARLAEVTCDLDSLPLEVHGSQPGSAWNGHYGYRCYHPLVLSWDRGDFLAAELREGNAHTADGALAFVIPALLWARTQAERVWLRMDAGFPENELLATLEDEGVRYVARLRGNARLKALAAPYLKRPAGRPPAEGRSWTHELVYRAGRWDRERRVVLVVLERPGEQGELFLDHFFLLTNVAAAEVDGAALLERYRARGEAERDFGDWKSTLALALSSSPRPKRHYRGRAVQGPEPDTDSYAANEARLLLSLLAANLLRAGAELVSRGEPQLLTRQRFRQLVLKVAGRVLVHGRRLTLVIEAARAPAWQRFWRELNRAYPARGSPALRALPTPA
jgi:hypothetical protein